MLPREATRNPLTRICGPLLSVNEPDTTDVDLSAASRRLNERYAAVTHTETASDDRASLHQIMLLTAGTGVKPGELEQLCHGLGAEIVERINDSDLDINDVLRIVAGYGRTMFWIGWESRRPQHTPTGEG